MHLNNKRPTQSKEGTVLSFLDQLKRPCLIDLYIDCLRMMHGEDLDGKDLVSKAKETNVETILNIRGDKMPKERP